MSEFGSGYATCLIQFAFHRARLAETVDMYARMRTERADLFSEAGAVELWANGASDHLYDLERPKSYVRVADWRAAQALASRALTIGHGFQTTSDPAECYGLLDEADRLLRLTGAQTLEAALAWDVAAGLEPDKGEWSCSEDLRRAVSA